jgi:hypothetical protein
VAEGNGAIFNDFKERVMKKEIDLVNDTIKVILVTGWTATVDGNLTYATFSGVTEESGTGYNVGGETLGSKTVTQDDTNNRAAFDGGDITWTGLNIGTPGHAVMYDDSHASDICVAYWELGTTATNGSDYKLSWHSNGIVLLT